MRRYARPGNDFQVVRLAGSVTRRRRNGYKAGLRIVGQLERTVGGGFDHLPTVADRYTGHTALGGVTHAVSVGIVVNGSP